MRKKIVSVILMLEILLSSTAYAVAPEDRYTEYKFYTAKVYICNPETQEIILRNVEPINPLDGLVNARAIEYRAIRINYDCIYDENGNRLSLDDVNAAYLDTEARVLTGKSRWGQRVMCVSFQKYRRNKK